MKTPLRIMFEDADETDRREGLLAYRRYHEVMRRVMWKYGFPLEAVTGAFVALSPNNDYVSNLRSLITLCHGVTNGTPENEIVTTTYNHCRKRAYMYLTGTPFLDHAKGPKTRAFYQNILDPEDYMPVTVDGHIAAAYRGSLDTVKANKVNILEYEKIAAAIRKMARHEGLIPNQLQAILWFTRKRLLNIKYDAQLDLFHASDDQWKTLLDIDNLRIFE